MSKLPTAAAKSELVQKIIEALLAELEGFARSAKSAQAEATDEQSKAENKYDTRGLEASYLARGQSKQAAETAAAVRQFQELRVQDLAPDAPVEVGALVEIEAGPATLWYFLGPCAGGTAVDWEGREVVVLSPQAPLGRELMGQREGHRFQMGGRKGAKHRIASVR